MGATWSDFTLVGSQTGTGPGTLTVNGVQKNDLIIAASAVSSYYRHWYWYGSDYIAAYPSHTATGVDLTEVVSRSTTPYEPYRYYYWYWRYWYWYWWCWCWRYYYWWWWDPFVVSRITIWVANSSGNVRVSFGEHRGDGAVIQTALRVWHPNITVGEYEAVRSIGFAQSAQAPTGSGNTASLPVVADELLLVMGMDCGWWPPGTITLTGPNVQELLDFEPGFYYRTARIKLYRVKTTATATATWSRCNIGKMMMKFVPNVEVYQLARPVPTEDNIYVEIQGTLTPSGRIIRPRWFDSLRSNYAWSYSSGLRKRWVREAVGGTDDSSGVRVIEMWKFPAAANNSIPEGEAYTWVDQQVAEARVIYNDLGW